MRRPRNLLWFEMLVAIACSARVIEVMTNSAVMQPGGKLSVGSHIALMTVVWAIPLPIAWLASHRANNVARWAFAAGSHAIAAIFVYRVFATDFGIGWNIVWVGLAAALDVAASWQLFQPEAQRWFRGERDPAEIADVFA